MESWLKKESPDVKGGNPKVGRNEDGSQGGTKSVAGFWLGLLRLVLPADGSTMVFRVCLPSYVGAA